jgi:hypothetical protein
MAVQSRRRLGYVFGVVWRMMKWAAVLWDREDYLNVRLLSAVVAYLIAWVSV